MERALASIQYIKSIDPIPGADFIVKVGVKGWSTVARKDEFKVGDPCVFFEVDSILPEAPEFEFMRDKKFRVRTMKFKKQLTQGLAMPLKEVSALWKDGSPLLVEDDIVQIEEGQNVTDIIGVVKHETPVPTCLGGSVIGRRPSFIKKTEEYRLQSYPEILKEFEGKLAYITEKLDGSSMSIFYSPLVKEFGVCSRNMQLAEDENNAFWKAVNRYSLKEIFPAAVENSDQNDTTFVIQAELCGPGIQKNRLELEHHDMFVFNVYDATNDKYLSYEDMEKFCGDLLLKTVPYIDTISLEGHTLETLLSMAEGKYAGTKNEREGIVIRDVESSRSEVLDGNLLSFKVLSNKYLLKED